MIEDLLHLASDLAHTPLVLAAVLASLLGAVIVLSGLLALLRLRPLRFIFRTIFGAALLGVGGAAAAILAGTQGYRAFNYEAVAGHLTVRPDGVRRFAATLQFPDGRESTYLIAGDEIYVDAHILKWKPAVNRLGLHTAYELDRIAGRYRDIEQERKSVRTVYALGVEKPFDVFALRQRYPFLEALVDVEYGSATFVPVTGPAELEIRVSTTGLLMRGAGQSGDVAG